MDIIKDDKGNFLRFFTAYTTERGYFTNYRLVKEEELKKEVKEEIKRLKSQIKSYKDNTTDLEDKLLFLNGLDKEI